MRRLKRKILRGTAAGVALAAALGGGSVVGALGSVNVLAQDTADTEAPVLKSLDIELPEGKSTVSPGDKIRVVVEATDNKSESILLDIGFNPIYQTNSGPIYLYKDEATGKYISVGNTITITDKSENREYEIESVSLHDENYNYIHYDASELANIPGTHSFTVTGSKQDIYAPNIESAEISNDTAKPGDIVTVTVRLNDIMPDGQEGVGIDDVYGTLRYGTQEEGGEKILNFTKQSDGSYKADITIDDSWYNDRPYKLRISTYDKVGNRLDGEDTGKTLTVTGSKEDKQGPEVTAWTFDKNEAVPGEIVTVTVDAYDPAGIKDGTFSLYTKINDDEFFGPVRGDWVEIKPDSTGKLTAQIKIDNSFKNGTYKVDYILVSDIFGNESGFYKDNNGELRSFQHYDEASGNWVDDNVAPDADEFTVSNSPGVYAAPKLKSIKFNKNLFAPGETVKVTAQLEDANEKVDSVDITVGTGEAGGEEINVTLYPTADGLLEGEFSAPYFRNIYNHVMYAFVTAGNDVRYYDWTGLDEMDTNEFIVIEDANTYTDADYSKVDEAIARVPENKDIYTPESLKVLEDVINAVERGKNINEQPKVNDYARAIDEAVRNLEKKPADYTKTDEAINSKPADTGIYTEESVKRLDDAIAAVVRDKKIDEQSDVDTFAEEIKKAIDELELKEADYSSVETAKQSAPVGAELDKYTPESVAVLQKAIAGVEEGKKITEQATVDEYARAIDVAVSGLELKDADYSSVDAAKEKVPSDEELAKYTKKSVDVLRAALANVAQGKRISEQAEVDSWAEAIKAAIEALELESPATEPSVEPETPVDNPTEPVDTPTEPVDTPTEPADNPTEPIDTPTEPVANPTEPSDTPTELVDAPTEPVDTPTEPVENPTEPVDTPTEPVENPTEPVDTPTEPVDNPTEPIDTPTEPVDNPTEPIDTPTEPGIPDNEGGKSGADVNTSGRDTDTQDDNTEKTGADSKESEKDSTSGEKQENTTGKTGEATNTKADNTTPVSNSGATAAGGTSATGSVEATGTATSAGRAVQPVQMTQTTEGTQTTPSETGDKTHTPLWIAAAGAAAAALAGVVVRRKKKTEK